MHIRVEKYARPHLAVSADQADIIDEILRSSGERSESGQDRHDRCREKKYGAPRRPSKAVVIVAPRHSLSIPRKIADWDNASQRNGSYAVAPILLSTPGSY